MRVYFVIGEESGDQLGADMLEWMNRAGDIEALGIAGPRMKALGVDSLFALDDIAFMGFGAVAAHLPTIIKRVKQTVADVLAKRPDVIVLIDSPDFTHAVAKRVRKAWPAAKVVNYVCPSVWAWRPGRAAKMRAYIDHVLCLLPFEPQTLRDLQGPPGTYVGHPLAAKSALHLQTTPKADAPLLLLPGSRRSEVEKLMPLLGDTLRLLRDRGLERPAVIPAVESKRMMIEDALTTWRETPKIVSATDNAKTFQTAAAALACSGTVTLELALAGVPTSVVYRTELLVRNLGPRFITAWSAVLPNIILDAPVISENIDAMAKPARLARSVEMLLAPSPSREAQLRAFERLADLMKTERPAGELAAQVALDIAKR